MTTIKEDYCSFELSKLLKEKGFPQEYDDYHALVYNEEDYEDEYEVQRMALETRIVKAGTLSSYPVGVPEPKCYCCTLQMAMKWLREEKNIFIDVYYDSDIKGYLYSIIKLPKGTTLNVSDLADDTYEVACEEAIKYCLENIL